MTTYIETAYDRFMHNIVPKEGISSGPIKVHFAVVGAPKSGKSTFCERLIRGQFLTSYEPTIGATERILRLRVCTLREIREAIVILYDCGGGEAYYADLLVMLNWYLLMDNTNITNLTTLYIRVL